jgi:dTDP-4-amino-4,6-dideoxygalactose transaminase
VHIPFVNLKKQYESLQQELDRALQDVFQQAQFIGGDTVRKFESAFAERHGIKQCVSTGNGTDALFIIMKALAIGPGDEVITPAFGVMASSETITLTGATPVFCDVDPEHYTLDAHEVIKKITPNTRAIIAVHLFGQAADVISLKKICTENDLYLLEDCAQSHLTKMNNQLAGTFGVAAAFSFYPTKNLGAYGDVGCILTNDPPLAEKMRRFANHGALYKDDHQLEGTNSRMDTLQAAVLFVKLKYLENWNNRRREIAALYTAQLNDLEQIILPTERRNSVHTFHLFGIRTLYRDSLKKYLSSHGIETLIHYPKAIPFTEAYKHFQHSAPDFPISAQLQQEILSLPVFPELTNEEVHFICKTIRQYFS